MKYLVCLFIVALWLSPNVARAEEISGGGIGGHSVDPTGSPPPFQPRPAGPDTGGPGRQAPPSGNIPNGAPYGPGSGPHPVIGSPGH